MIVFVKKLSYKFLYIYSVCDVDCILGITVTVKMCAYVKY